ncbi:MAG: signal transduction histidine kinase [Rhodospirillales bacterium]|nr:signal transduction histidine kinase [Rhodospirillales bacterium]
MNRLRRTFTALARRFTRRPDTEHQQALIRVVIMGVIVVYLAATRAPGTKLFEFDGAFVAGLWFLTAFPILLWIALRPGVSHVRRLIGMVGDFGALSIVLLLDGETGTPLFLMYLWVGLGNGFRYGLRALLLATAISASFFAVVLYFSPFWRDLPELSIGLLMCLIAIPLYAASLIKQLTEAKEQADRANRAKSRFLAVMSHELRTPLNAIIGANDVLRGTRMDGDQAEMTRTIGQAGRSLLSLIEDVLDLSRIEAGKERVERVTFDLYADVAETVSMLQIQARRKGLLLAVQIAAEVPDQVQGGRQQLRQILFNLIANAIKFTDTGSVRLRIRPTPAGPIAFDVIDTGVGIEPEHLSRIFDSFTQVDESVGRRHDGAGLGLAIVKQLTELMHGTVSVQSVPKSGSVFTVEVPLQPVAAAEPAVDVASLVMVVSRDPSVAAAFTARGLRVEPVEHAASLRAMLQQADENGRSIVVDDRTPFRIADFPSGLLRASDLVVAVGDGAFGSISFDLDAACVGRLGWPASPASIDRTLRLLVPRPVVEDQPIVERIEPVADQDTAGPAAPSSRRATPARVLVAEDNPVNCRVIDKILRRGGFEPTIVNNGDDALDRLEAERFDLFIVDVNMPGTSGIDVVKLYAIQQLGQERIPIVALTADTTLETQRRCIEAGVDSFLPKPIEADRLLRTLEGLLAAAGRLALGQGTRDGRVADITLHPRFQPSGDQVIDRDTLRELSELDADPAFLDEIVGIYVADSESLLDDIEEAVRHRDYAQFRDLLHALRSASANVGAQQLHAVCAQMSGIERSEFQAKASEYLARLSHEFTRYRVEVQAWLERKAESGHAN